MDDEEEKLVAEVDKLYARFIEIESRLEEARWRLRDYRMAKMGDRLDVGALIEATLNRVYSPKYLKPIRYKLGGTPQIVKDAVKEHLSNKREG